MTVEGMLRRIEKEEEAKDVRFEEVDSIVSLVGIDGFFVFEKSPKYGIRANCFVRQDGEYKIAGIGVVLGSY